jgi:hypothetical protein
MSKPMSYGAIVVFVYGTRFAQMFLDDVATSSVS